MSQTQVSQNQKMLQRIFVEVFKYTCFNEKMFCDQFFNQIKEQEYNQVYQNEVTFNDIENETLCEMISNNLKQFIKIFSQEVQAYISSLKYDEEFYNIKRRVKENDVEFLESYDFQEYKNNRKQYQEVMSEMSDKILEIMYDDDEEENYDFDFDFDPRSNFQEVQQEESPLPLEEQNFQNDDNNFQNTLQYNIQMQQQQMQQQVQVQQQNFILGDFEDNRNEEQSRRFYHCVSLVDQQDNSFNQINFQKYLRNEKVIPENKTLNICEHFQFVQSHTLFFVFSQRKDIVKKIEELQIYRKQKGYDRTLYLEDKKNITNQINGYIKKIDNYIERLYKNYEETIVIQTDKDLQYRKEKRQKLPLRKEEPKKITFEEQKIEEPIIEEQKLPIIEEQKVQQNVNQFQFKDEEKVLVYDFRTEEQKQKDEQKNKKKQSKKQSKKQTKKKKIEFSDIDSEEEKNLNDIIEKKKQEKLQENISKTRDIKYCEFSDSQKDEPPEIFDPIKIQQEIEERQKKNIENVDKLVQMINIRQQLQDSDSCEDFIGYDDDTD